MTNANFSPRDNPWRQRLTLPFLTIKPLAQHAKTALPGAPHSVSKRLKGFLNLQNMPESNKDLPSHKSKRGVKSPIDRRFRISLAHTLGYHIESQA
jgi:hypothetical protein